MASHELIDAQFDRAVEIVQSLPKTGPIQTDYEEKLTILFKQATAGNVKSPRPGIWDMLGRAKWDAWAKHKDLDPYEAKWLYVEALLKVLSKYSDKTVAKNLIEELESYGGDPSHIVMSRTLSKSTGSDSSGSTVSDNDDVGQPYRPNIPFAQQQQLMQQDRLSVIHSAPEDEESNCGDDSGDEVHELPNASRQSLDNRPQSSMSSQRYRTPLAGSLAYSPPPPQHHVPAQQPLPTFETPSAFDTSSSQTPQYQQPRPNQFPGTFSDTSREQMMSPPHGYPGHPNYRVQQLSQSHPSQYSPARPPSAMALERAVEGVQVHLAALTERLETLESRSLLLSRSNVSVNGGGGSPSWVGGRRSPNDAVPVWDIDDLGMWSLVLNPMSRGLDRLRELATFFASNSNRSPSMIIIRRLCLDVSFLLCVIGVIGALWRKSGVRRREVKAALIVLWRAIVGSKQPRLLIDQGI
ncbi:ACBP-domain-containing protein [Agrocybe pediades]|nr:ACBP-domain-containing protein [Agrocybe pediades]